VGVVGWGVIRIFTRGPFKKVLQPSAWGGREDQEPEDEDLEDEREETTAEPAEEEPSPPLRVACSACGKKLRVPGEMAGRSVRCPGCRGVVAVPAAPPSAGTAARPRSASKRPKPAPKGGSKAGLILGAAALVLGSLALALGLLTSLPAVVLVAAGTGLLTGGAGVVIALRERGVNPRMPIAGGAVSLLALVVAVILLLASPAQPDAVDAPVAVAPGEKGRAGNVPGGKAPEAAPASWGEPLDPDGDCTITPQGNALTVIVPPTRHDILADKAGKSNAPRVLREVDGDFRVQVKVCGSIHPTAKGSVPGRLPFQAAGLLVWGDQDNFLRLVRTGQIRKGVFESIAAFRLRAQGQPSGGQVLAVPDKDVYLRLERKGKQIEGSYSLDGQQWTPLGALSVPFPARVHVGVMALNTVAERLTVRFEDLQIWR
jgi:regulation of enolase protein 1 (concanavalin A-like superfamily)